MQQQSFVPSFLPLHDSHHAPANGSTRERVTPCNADLPRAATVTATNPT